MRCDCRRLDVLGPFLVLINGTHAKLRPMHTADAAEALMKHDFVTAFVMIHKNSKKMPGEHKCHQHD